MVSNADVKRPWMLEMSMDQRVMHESELRYRRLFEAAQDGILILDGKTGAIVDANPFLTHSIGYSRDELLGKMLWQIGAFVDIETAKKAFVELESKGYVRYDNLQLRRKDGRLLEVEFISSAYDVGEVRVYQCNIRDITEQRKLEQLNKVINTRFRALVENSAEMIVLITSKGTIDYVSPASDSVLGYKPSESIGQSFLDFIYVDDRQAAKNLMAELAKRPNEPLRYELRHQHKNGSIVYIEGVACFLPDTTGIYGVVANLRDVTQRKQAEAELRLADARNRMKLVRAQKQLAAVRFVSKSELLAAGEVEALARMITESAAEASGTERVSVWLFNADATELHCIDLFELTPAHHSSGMVLQERELRNEFHTLKTDDYVVADDALTDPRTAGYVETYLKPLQITSMLDAVIRNAGAHVGLLRFQHVNRPHHWEWDETSFAGQLADKLGLCTEIRKRRRLSSELLEAQRVTHVGNWLLITATGEVTWSEEIYRVFGWDPAKPAPDYPQQRELFTPDSFARLDAAISECRHLGIPYQLELQLLSPLDKQIWIETRGEAVRDTNGVVVALRGTAQDITQRKNVELNLELFRTLIDQSGDAIGVVDSETLRFMNVNQQFYKSLGYSREELLQMTVRDIDPQFSKEKQLALEGRLAKGEVIVFEAANRRKKGTTFPVEVNLKRVVLNRSYQVAVIRDITDRKRAEAALRSSQQLIEGILNAIPVRVFWKDKNLAYLGCNTPFARDAGFTNSQELLGKDDYQMARREQADLYRGDDQAVIDSGHPKLLFEEPSTTSDGKVITLLTSKLPLRDTQGQIIGVLGTYMDITEHKQQAIALARMVRALKALSAGNNALVHAKSEEQLYADMTRAVVESGGYRMAWVGLVEHGEGSPILPVGKAGDDTGYVSSLQISWSDSEHGGGPTGQCVRTGKPVVSRDIASDPVMAPWRIKALAAGFAASASFPLLDGGLVFGTLTMYSTDKSAFDADEIVLLSEMAGDLAYGVLNLRSGIAHLENLKLLERSMESTVEALAATVEIRDPYTAGHQRRVADIAFGIGTLLGLPADRLRGLRLAATIHDIGKLSVPAEILSKPSKLTAIEYELIKCHAEAGYEIVKDIEFPWPVAEMVRQHHERLDGTGYPRGLKREQILPEAKILAIADVMESMASHRPYRSALGIDAALAEIARGRDTAYDADAADACLKLFRERGYKIPD